MGLDRHAVRSDGRGDVQHRPVRLLARPAPLHGLLVQQIGIGARRDLHLQFILRTSLIPQVQGRRLLVGISKRAEIWREGDAGQASDQVCAVFFAVVWGAQQAVDVLPDDALGDLEGMILLAELLQKPVGVVVDAPVAGHVLQTLIIHIAIARVRADAHITQRQTLLFNPLSHSLSHQGNGGDKVEHTATHSNLLLRNPERYRRFPCAAREDQLAAVVLFEARQHLLYGVFLVRMGRIGLTGLKPQALRIVDILPPVHVPVVQLRPVDNSAKLRRGLESLQGVFLDGAAGVDDQPLGEMFRFRRRHEGADATLGHRVVKIEKLALDSAQPSFFLFD